MAKELYGRTVIYSNILEITNENVCDVLSSALSKHNQNVNDIKYLEDYYKGKTPIQKREKTYSKHINNKINENRAYEIVNFKVGYLLGEPIQYVANEPRASEPVARLNKMMNAESKSAKDRAIVEWQEICGTGYRMILADKDLQLENEDVPFELLTLDPKNAFVIYGNDISKKAIAGVYLGTDENGNNVYSVYTKTQYFYIVDNQVVEALANPYGEIPIIEYPANPYRLGAFEVVLPLLDALNNVTSNRVDGIEQFIQSLAIAVNCDFPDGTTADDIKQAGLLVLKSIGENKADFKVLSQELNQQQTQTLVDYINYSIDKIVGLPSQANGNTSDSSNNGAVILKNGWQGAEARAKDREIIFKESETKTLKFILNLLDKLNMSLNLSLLDVDYRFTRRCYEDVYTKAQVLNLLLNNPLVNPKDAYNVSGLFTDSELAYVNGIQWLNENKVNEDDESNNREIPQ